MVNVFAPAVFFIVFRETLEASIIISVLLSFLKQSIASTNDNPQLYKALVRQVWVGGLFGLGICLIIGGAFIGVFYGLGSDIWGSTEDIWEGVFSIIASIIISIMGLAMLRMNKMKAKWRVKIAKAILAKDDTGDADMSTRWKRIKYRVTPSKQFTSRYAFFILPFVTTLREGIEAIVFIGGVGLALPATSFPIPVITGFIAGVAVGYLIYKGGNYMSIQIFLIVSTCFLYLVGGGLFSKAVWYFENYAFSQLTGGDASENGVGPGSYDIRKSVWHVNCCNPESSGGWMIFNALFGWQNSATVGSVVSYCAYWIAVMIAILISLYAEKRGDLPFLPMFLRKKWFLDAKEEDLEAAEKIIRQKALGVKNVITKNDEIELSASGSSSDDVAKKDTSN
ncbi:hypothetical protein CANCADRAFT_30511 [Tortispora caseinolytica NRRL Y-17796]|uniref:Plasma membrane iron permease n=1 Tax=Tortispora caseinolytica NRRL Y-17796 TaxID=767744 RepID=A0A1E4TKP4_9ASCO|nr:hypothetical protein CANCADRAFT_30511 [Tortispora caseinolytica NRRL Y-17796]